LWERQHLRLRCLIFGLADRIKEFREWLWTRPDPATAKDVLDAYASLVVSGSKERLSYREWFKIMRVVGVAFAGGTLGSAATAGLAGAAAATVSNFVGAGVSHADLLIDRILKKKNPRRFAAVLRDEKVIAEIGRRSNTS